MKLFGRDNKNRESIPVDLQPYYTGQESGIRRWIGPIFRGLLLIALLILLAWGGVWLVHKLTNRDSDSKKANQQSTAQQATPSTTSETPASSAKNQATTSPAVTPAPTPTLSPTPQTTSTPTSTPTPAPATPNTPSPGTTSPTDSNAAQSQKLANTGPGEVAAIFASATLLGTVLYRTLLTRRLRDQ